jgi:hypothetical protein
MVSRLSRKFLIGLLTLNILPWILVAIRGSAGNGLFVIREDLFIHILRVSALLTLSQALFVPAELAARVFFDIAHMWIWN